MVIEICYRNIRNLNVTKLVIEMEKAKILINKPVYLGLSMLQLSKTVIYEFWYDYEKPNYSEQAKPCCMDTNSFILYIKTDDI